MTRPYPGQFTAASWGGILLLTGWSPVHHLDKKTILWMQAYAANHGYRP